VDVKGMGREMGTWMCAFEALPDASGDENQLKRIYNRWFHALGSVFLKA